jgi:hypothetical protein
VVSIALRGGLYAGGAWLVRGRARKNSHSSFGVSNGTGLPVLDATACQISWPQASARHGAVEVEAFLTHLAVEDKVGASTQNQALQALSIIGYSVIRRLSLY